uniref:Uncharacterized protein n=1 Tax=Pyrodinium bahamense TaxID=73915 RepID=A0A7S0A3X2_9DINO
MGDEEEAATGDFDDTEVVDDGEGGDGGDGPLPPCASCAIGVVCLVVSVCGLFLNEGAYVDRMRALEQASASVLMPCSSDCSRCSFASAREARSGKTRELRSGDLVYVACDLQNLGDVSALQGQARFQPQALAGLLQPANPGELSQRAAKFTWQAEMMQSYFEPKQLAIPDLTKFENGKYKNNPKAYCKHMREKKCDGRLIDMARWTRRTFTTTTSTTLTSTSTATPTSTKATPTTSSSRAGGDTGGGGAEPAADECKGLNHNQCDQKPDKCAWDWRCPKITNEEECSRLGPVECQWASSAIKVKGKDCKGCCPTESTWRVACKPKPALRAPADFSRLDPQEWHETRAPEVGQKLLQWPEEQREQEGEDREQERGQEWEELALEPEEEEEAFEEPWWLADAARPSPGPAESEAPQRRLGERCSWKACWLRSGWCRDLKPAPSEWPAIHALPDGGSWQHAAPPAFNLKALDDARGAYSLVSKVRLGAKGAGEGLRIDKLEDEIFPKFVPVELAAHIPERALQSNVTEVTYTRKDKPQISVKLLEMRRDEPSAAWTDKNSVVGGEACDKGCICSWNNISKSYGGNLRLCLHRSSTFRLSVVAEAQALGDGWELARPQKLGVISRLNELVPLDKLIEEEKAGAYGTLKAMRLLLPLVMWVGLYCCLSPIVWVLDQFGEVVEMVPCVGGIAGGLVECMETLADFAICLVSCCGALACSLLVASFAWVWFRPLVGVPLLVLSVCFFGGLAGFALSRRGAAKVRGKRRSVRETGQGQVVELGVSMSLPSPSQPVHFAVICPAGVGPGSLVQAQAPDGRVVQVQVPDGIAPGQQFAVVA